MKNVVIECLLCGHWRKVEIWTREEAIRARVLTEPVRCHRCGYNHVRIR